MRFAVLAIMALVASVQGVEIHNQAHARGLKEAHQQLAQEKAKGSSKEHGIDWRGAAGAVAGIANHALNG